MKEDTDQEIERRDSGFCSSFDKAQEKRNNTTTEVKRFMFTYLVIKCNNYLSMEPGSTDDSNTSINTIYCFSFLLKLFKMCGYSLTSPNLLAATAVRLGLGEDPWFYLPVGYSWIQFHDDYDKLVIAAVIWPARSLV